MPTWVTPIIVAGICSAVSIISIRYLAIVAPHMSAIATAAAYSLVSGLTLSLAAALSKETLPSAFLHLAPLSWGLIVCIGVAYALLEYNFALASYAKMPLPDALILYNVTNLALVAVLGMVMFGEPMTLVRLAGVGFGALSIFLLLQPTTRTVG